MKGYEERIQKNFEAAKAAFKDYGVDVDAALKKFDNVTVSLHCWQGDDVKGFENLTVASQNVVTGSYPGAARNADELRMDIDTACALSPIKHKINLHSVYAEGSKGRLDTAPQHFANWISWAKEKGYGLDFNASFFAHPMMDGSMSLSSPKKAVRDFWIEVGKNAREIAYEMGKATGQKCIHNIWVPDGMKDVPADRFGMRARLLDSLDKIIDKKYDKKVMADVVEGKLFGIGAECFTTGSHEFYAGYALSRGIGLCMDSGHYHPTESVADKLSSFAPFIDDILLHVSRGVRWDSDHVIVQNDDLLSIFEEIARGNLYGKVHIGLDYFDASVNRIAAWSVGLRAAGKSIITSLLQPVALLKDAEEKGDYTTRLVLTDEMRNLPYNAVWEYILAEKGIPVGKASLDTVKTYEKDVLSKRA